MASHFFRHTVASLLGIITLTAAVLTGPTSASAQVLQSNPFSTDGSVVSVGKPIPTVPGATGSFVLGNLRNTTGYITPAENAGGQVTIDETSSTSYFACNSSGQNCKVASAPAVVVAGNELFVSGHYFVENGRYELVAEYVFSPPPAPSTSSASPPMPTPTGFYDYEPANAFGVTGYVVSPGTYLDNQLLWSPLWGFTLGRFGDFPNGYGCGTTSGCLTQRIAESYSNHLFIDATALTTAFWISHNDGCTYQKTSDTYAVVNSEGATAGLTATGRFLYSGNEWRFFASNVFAPPPQPPSAFASGGACEGITATYGPVSASSSSITETGRGAPAPGSSGYTGSSSYTATTWQGSFGAGFGYDGGVFSGGSIQLTLNWSMVPASTGTPAHWHFDGIYEATSESGSTSFSGQISGSAGIPAGGSGSAAVNATMTMDRGTGQFAGFSGYGNSSGSALYGEGQALPVLQDLSFTWHVEPTAASTA